MTDLERITAHLRSKIISGELRHGSVIQISSGVQFYGVSRNTVVAAVKALSSLGYLEYDERGRILAYSWDETRIDDQFRLGSSLLEIAAETLISRGSEYERMSLAQRLIGVAIEGSQTASDPDPLIVDAVHSFTATAAFSPVAGLGASFSNLFPSATRRIALASMELGQLRTVTDAIGQMGDALAASNARNVTAALTVSLETMRSRITDKARQLSKHQAYPVADLAEADALPGITPPLPCNVAETLELEKWLAEAAPCGIVSAPNLA